MKAKSSALDTLKLEVGEDVSAEAAYAEDVCKLRLETKDDPPSKKVHAHLAIARNATQADKEQMTLIASQPDSEIAEFNYSTDAASLWLSYCRMPPRLRGFVDAINGLAGERGDWFEATDIRIGKRMGRSTKTVQRDRDDLNDWQKENRVTFIEIEDHVTDSRGRRHPHKYKVHLPRLAVEAKREAQASSRWMSDPAKALEHAVKAGLRRTPGMSPRREHGRRQAGLEQTIDSDLRRAARLILKSAKNLKSAELAKLTRGYMLSVGVKPELLSALEHSLQILKGEAEPDDRILAPLDTDRQLSSGQNVRKETIHSDSEDEVAVLKDMPTAEPVSEYWRVPSVARAALKRGEQPPPEVRR